ncbi:MAG: polyprenyl synthetase family protein [Gammaproteobacteria bacterium]|nr:polyprenyl synthetase family protein [Gammaproteobacteria bacterium]NNJ73096.1 geranyl transferase [Enterobacterales bacterium]
MPFPLKQRLTECQTRIDRLLDENLPADSRTPKRLHEAMRYSSLNAGKRLRPLLVYLVGEALGAKETDLDAPALAVECIHVYSLIHDDLPAMDNDDLRRGKATCHIAFDEATAILAGDALQTTAFDILCNLPLTPDVESQRIKMIQILSRASGSLGMGGGQMIDLLATDKGFELNDLVAMHGMKTGALIKASVMMAMACCKELDNATQRALETYADKIGLAFQVKDDILDIEGEADLIGKPIGSDVEANKSTFPALMGVETAKQYAENLIQEALLTLQGIPYNTEALKQVANYIVERQH